MVTGQTPRRLVARRPSRVAEGPRAAVQRPLGAAREKFEIRPLINGAPSAKIEDSVFEAPS
jgi:hypothetical protein